MNDKPLERWNNADTTLLCAALCFLAAVGVNKIYPESILAEGFLFVTEAAMVGGIADWFAVTALFKKPLGFPFHTAILPNRRNDFVNASVQMVQDEFFSKRTVFKKMGHIKLLPLLIEYLDKPSTREFLLTQLFNIVRNYFASMNKQRQARIIANKLRRTFGEIPIGELTDKFGAWIRSGDKDTELFVAIIKRLREIAATSETREKLQEVLETYANERTKSAGAFSILMAGLAQMLDFVNFSEAAEIMQVQLLKLLDELASDSPLRNRTLNECRLKIAELVGTQEFRDLAEHLQVDLATELPLETAIEAELINFERQLQSLDAGEFFASARESTISTKDLGVKVASLLVKLYNELLESLKVDGVIKVAAEKFISELTARAAFYAQPLVGAITKNALGKMTVDQLNNLVYGKAEDDFIWIRMNGSIVGAFVGIIIFVLIKLIS